jgi:hypothetical protein
MGIASKKRFFDALGMIRNVARLMRNYVIFSTSPGSCVVMM